MHGRQINPYEISHFARCNTLVLISITHSIQCNYAFYPKGGVALCTQASEGGKRGWAIDRGLALSCIPKIWQFMWSASAISISDKVRVPRKLLNTFSRKRQREQEREMKRGTPIGTELQHRLRPRPQGGRHRQRHCLGAFQISWHPVWVRFCAAWFGLVWFGSVLNFN